MTHELDPRKLNVLYRRGILGLQDVIGLAVRLAVEHSPDTFADTLPTDALENIEYIAGLPPEERLALGTPTIANSAEREAAVLEMNRLTTEGLARWQNYFVRIAACSAAPSGLSENG